MYILTFETLSNFISIAIFKNNSLIDSFLYDKSFSHAESILVLIESLTLRNKINYSDIDYFVTATGPSSFIKIRIGLSVSYGIEFTTNKKVYGINLFDLYESILKKDGISPDLIILNAYQDNFYVRSIGEYGIIDEFLPYDEITKKINNLTNVACDSKSYSRFNCNNLIKITDVESKIRNLSVALGEYFIDPLNNSYFLEKFDDLKPFYLFNPKFVKKSDVKKQ